MLNQSGFDLWAGDYDRSVGLSDEENTYPFAGYKRLLGRIYEIVLQKERPAVLDLGFGTGVLTARLCAAGCRIWGQDFSARMIELAQEKMPGALLVQGDFSEGLAPVLRERSYDFIISTYALHHLDVAGKLRLIREALGRLSPGGELLIGDVAFATREAQDACRAAAGEEWDEDECYTVFEELQAVFPEAEFEPISFCAGIFRWIKPETKAEAGSKSSIREAPADELEVYIPRLEDGWFYVKMMSDPATMAYNAPWFPPDGCIPDAAEEWARLCETWIGKEPQRFYAFLRRTSDGAFVGDINFHYNPEKDWWDMGVVIYAPERGKGYGKRGLELLLDRAFRVAGIAKLHNDFETTRDAAYHIHRAVGFREVGIEDGIIHLELTREQYLSKNRSVIGEEAQHGQI